MRIGIDVGGTKIDAILLDAASNIRHRARRPTARGAHGVLDGVEQIIRQLLNDTATSATDITGIGVGIPGVIDAPAGVVRHAVNLDIEELALVAELTRRFGIAVTVDNDVNAAALGAAHLLNVDTSLGFLNLGTGLAAGIVIDKKVWRGSRGGAGEIGHIPTDRNGPECFCGQSGCHEAIASGSAIARLWPTAAPIPAVDLFDAADAGDYSAVEIRDTVVHGVASAVRVIVLSTDVDHVVIGGGVSNLGHRLHEPLLHIFRAWSRTSPFLASLDLPARVQLVPAGTPIAALGAAYM